MGISLECVELVGSNVAREQKGYNSDYFHNKNTFWAVVLHIP